MFQHLISSNTVEIAAPIERVRQILVDAERYRQWNPFTTRIETDFAVGSPIDLYVSLGPLKLRQPERIEAVDRPCLLVWSTKMGQRFLLSAHREQRLEALGAGRCCYHTTDAFTGFLTPLVVLLFGRLIRLGFNDMAWTLKRYAEAE